MDRIVSVSTMAFDGYSLEVALDELAALGVKYVEPASVDKVFQHLVEEDFCDRRAAWLRAELLGRGLSCLSLSAHMDLTQADSADRFHRRLEFARNIGARCVNSIDETAVRLFGSSGTAVPPFLQFPVDSEISSLVLAVTTADTKHGTPM
jgi:sugar phosphate isomerase/epimerase